MAKNDSLQKVALTIASLGAFLTPFMSASINIALPAIGNEFKMNANGLSWVATSYLLAAAMFLVPVGRWADIHGRKKMYLTGIIIYAISSLLCGLSFNAVSLIIFRLLQGIGGSMIFSTGVAILTSVFPKEKRGWALGLTVASVYIGLSSGPVLGGIMTEYTGWRSIFFLNVAVAIPIIILILRRLRHEWAESAGESFDLSGSVIYALSILGIIYGLSLLPEQKGFYFLGSGVVLLLIFVWFEKRLQFPVMNTRLIFSNRVFAYSNLAALINYSATFAVGFLLSIYLQVSRGFSPKIAGMILVSQPLLMALFSPFAGRLSDKVDPRIIASMGMALTAFGLLMIVFFTATTSIFYIIPTLVVIGLGFAFFSSPNTNAIMSSVEKKHFGFASATTSTMRLTGQMLSMGVTMFILNIYIGKSPVTSANAGMFNQSMHTAFIIFSSLCFVGVIASVARGKKKF